MGWRVVPLAAVALPLCLIAEQLPIRSYTTADGLASDQINCVVPDSRGFVWFCTPEGLTRFDGYRMVTFGTRDGLPDRAIAAFLETRSGAYIVGTNHGISRLDPNAGGHAFVTYRQGTSLFDQPIRTLFESSSGRIWCGSNEARLFEVLSAGDLRLTKLPAKRHPFVEDIKEDAGGKLWVATSDGIYVLGKDGAVRLVTRQLGQPHDWASALSVDHAGRIWAATRGGLLLMRDADAVESCGVQRAYWRKDGLPASVNDLHALAEGPDGATWVSTNVGISVLPASGRPPFRNLTRDHGLTDRSITSLAVDKAGDIWAGTESAGVMRIGTAGFVTFHERDRLTTDEVYSIFADRQGRVVAVTAPATSPRGRSVNVFDPVNLKFHTVVPKVFGEHAIWAVRPSLLQARSGEWWAATEVGLCRFAPVSVEQLARRQPLCYYSEPGLHIFTVFEDSKGGIWAVGQSLRQDNGNRLWRWDPQQNAISRFDGAPTRSQFVLSFAEDRHGNIWMGPTGGDLCRYDGRQFTRFKRSDGVPAGNLRALLVDHKGRLWMGSRQGRGLGLVEDPGSAPFRVRTYNMASGMASDIVSSLVEDNLGRIYAGTGKGVDRLDPATGCIKHFSSADGLARGDVGSAFRDSSGNLWFGTMEGLSRLTPTADPPARPTVLITDLKIFGKPYPVSYAGEAHIRLPELDHSRNQLQVSFVGFDGEPEDRLRYTYKLDGAGSDWKAPDREHEANYPGLTPGDYRFLVKAVNSEDQASETPAEIDFTVLPPFYRRWWFESLAAAMMVCLVFAAYRYRLLEMTARVKERYEERLDERTRIARELHDTLLQSLAGVSLHLDGIAKQIAPSSEPVAAQIRTVCQRVDTTFREARQKVQDLRSPMLHGRDLPTVMQESLEQIAAGHPVRLRMTVAGQPRPLRQELEEAVLRIGQEAVANAVRHAQAGEIQVEMIYGDGSLSLRVQDDGQGFNLDDARQRVGHWGLRNMQERAHRIGAQWKITTSAGCGTGIETIVPLTGDD